VSSKYKAELHITVQSDSVNSRPLLHYIHVGMFTHTMTQLANID